MWRGVPRRKSPARGEAGEWEMGGTGGKRLDASKARRVLGSSAGEWERHGFWNVLGDFLLFFFVLCCVPFFCFLGRFRGYSFQVGLKERPTV